MCGLHGIYVSVVCGHSCVSGLRDICVFVASVVFVCLRCVWYLCVCDLCGICACKAFVYVWLAWHVCNLLVPGFSVCVHIIYIFIYVMKSHRSALYTHTHRLEMILKMKLINVIYMMYKILF